MAIRQPIVSILGHVDHGKTTLLDSIRGTTVAAREAGAITQHIGATEVPVETIHRLCAKLGAQDIVKIPGLLFIDTPGHHSFTTLRSRGGSLADLAVLIVDINEGFKPQTMESIQILKRFKTPYLVAANKIDRLQGWRHPESTCYVHAVPSQPPHYQAALDEKLYRLIGEFSDIGIGADIFSNITDFTSSVAIVPVSAKEGTGIPELLMVLIGLAQRFLGERLEKEEGGGAEGTILEVKEHVGLGTTLDTIIYKGELHRGDTIVVGAKPKPLVTKVKALLKPKPLDEIRDPREQFDSMECVTAAAGIKISAQNLEGAIAGTPVRVVSGDPGPYVEQMMRELDLKVETVDEGIIVKADAIGSLEALAYEAKAADIPIKMASTGAVSKRDIIEAATIPNPLYKVVMGFNVVVHPEAREELENCDVKLFTGDIVYSLIEEYQEWREVKKRELDSADRKEVVFPGKVLFMANHTFRINKPAIVGIRILGGRIRVGQRLIRSDGKTVGRVRSLRSGNEAVAEAVQGQEVAVAIEGATVGRQLKEEDVLYVDMPESDARELNGSQRLNFDEQQVLDEYLAIKRREDHFWGR